jgi:tetratricopeptide (TPR) repeat protein
MSNLENMHQKAATLYEEKKLQEALAIYQDIIKLNPADEVALSCVMDIYLELDDKFNYYLSRANVNIASGKIEYAINDTKKALTINNDDIDLSILDE